MILQLNKALGTRHTHIDHQQWDGWLLYSSNLYDIYCFFFLTIHGEEFSNGSRRFIYLGGV